MRTLLGSFFLCFSFSVSAGNVLFLRGFVPLNYKVETLLENNSIKARVRSNDLDHENRPKLKIEKYQDHFVVVVVQS